MYKVGAYIRVSTSRKEQESSLLTQRLMCEQYSDRKGWELTNLYTDRKTGTKVKRPALFKLLDDIEAKVIDVIVVKDLSRLARNGELSYKVANLAKEKGVHIISLDGLVNTMEGNTDIVGLLAWLYEKESENLSGRIKSAKKAGALNGEYQGSVPPYGYYLKNKKLFIRNDETPNTVRRIYSEYLKGRGVDSIAKMLTLEGIPTPAQVINKQNAGLEWRGSTIKLILKNPHYIGDLVQGRTETISVVSTGRREIGIKEQIIVEGTHERIISKVDFRDVQKNMIKRKKNLTAPKAHLFTNVAFCADCGRGMWFRSSRKGYICGSYGRYGRDKCASHAIKEADLLESIVKEFKLFSEISNVSIFSKQFETKIKKTLNINMKQLKNIQNKLTVLQNRKIRYVQMLADGKEHEGMDEQTFKLANTKNDKEIKDLLRQQESLETSTNQNKHDLQNIKMDFEKYLYSEEVIIEIIHRFISRVEVKEDGTVKIYYYFQDPIKKVAS